ncbi:hypothetical protein FCX14_23545, partial [Escherichia coli]|nr:hypothetical protein [Escherichia coli]
MNINLLHEAYCFYFHFFFLLIAPLIHAFICSTGSKIFCKRLVRTVLIFTESSDQLSRATDRVPGLP